MRQSHAQSCVACFFPSASLLSACRFSPHSDTPPQPPAPPCPPAAMLPSLLALPLAVLALPRLAAAQGDLGAANNVTDLEGTWSSNSAVSTGGVSRIVAHRAAADPRPQDICIPAEMKFNYPNNSGISYSLYVDPRPHAFPHTDPLPAAPTTASLKKSNTSTTPTPPTPPVSKPTSTGNTAPTPSTTMVPSPSSPLAPTVASKSRTRVPPPQTSSPTITTKSCLPIGESSSTRPPGGIP